VSDAINAKSIAFGSGNKRHKIELQSRLTKPLFSSIKRRDKIIVSDLRQQAIVNSQLKMDPFVSQTLPQTAAKASKSMKQLKLIPPVSLVAYESDD